MVCKRMLRNLDSQEQELRDPSASPNFSRAHAKFALSNRKILSIAAIPEHAPKLEHVQESYILTEMQNDAHIRRIKWNPAESVFNFINFLTLRPNWTQLSRCDS
jgi:hypothetical protein